jgi:hypothetical protein
MMITTLHGYTRRPLACAFHLVFLLSSHFNSTLSVAKPLPGLVSGKTLHAQSVLYDPRIGLHNSMFSCQRTTCLFSPSPPMYSTSLPNSRRVSLSSSQVPTSHGNYCKVNTGTIFPERNVAFNWPCQCISPAPFLKISLLNAVQASLVRSSELLQMDSGHSSHGVSPP